MKQLVRWLLLCCFLSSFASCSPRRTTVVSDAATHAHHADSASRQDVQATREDAAVNYGPPSPWGDGAIPSSTATGPEADRTRSSLTALRASIGFWRVVRRMRDRCPTHAQLASTPAAAYDANTMARDAWGSPLVIDCLGANVRLRSLGPDRVAETADDLLSE